MSEKEKLYLEKGESEDDGFGNRSCECLNCGRYEVFVRPGKTQCNSCGYCVRCGYTKSWIPNARGDKGMEQVQFCLCETRMFGLEEWDLKNPQPHLTEMFDIIYTDRYNPNSPLDKF